MVDDKADIEQPTSGAGISQIDLILLSIIQISFRMLFARISLVIIIFGEIFVMLSEETCH